MIAAADTQIAAPIGLPQSPLLARLTVAALARCGVFIAVALSGIVFTEPAPVDVIMIALIVLLPATSLTRLSPSIALVFVLWLGCSAGALIATTQSHEFDVTLRHTAVSIYLCCLFLILAVFVHSNPVRHAHVIFKAWVLAALVAAAAGLAGYFQIVPGAHDLFTKFGRAAGTFKDPNVLGPFLVPPILYLVHQSLNRPRLHTIFSLGAIAALTLAVLVSFSRGAWLNLGVALAIYGVVRLAAEHSALARARLLLIAMAVTAVAVLGLLALSQSEQVGELLAERSAIAHDYDIGPDGRFGGQAKAFAMALDSPLGLGARQFSTRYHPEDVHNVYISMLLNAGWLGGLLYLAIIVVTLACGLARVAEASPVRGLLLVAYASFLANVIEGAIIDTDHWRHFYILLALIWGSMGAAASARTETRT